MPIAKTRGNRILGAERNSERAFNGEFLGLLSTPLSCSGDVFEGCWHYSLGKKMSTLSYLELRETQSCKAQESHLSFYYNDFMIVVSCLCPVFVPEGRNPGLEK